MFGHAGVAGVDPNKAVVGPGTHVLLRLPYKPHLDPPTIAIPFGLGGSDVLEVSSQSAGGEELAVGDRLLLLRDQLLDFFMIYSCQE